MEYIQQIQVILQRINKIAKAEEKSTGFCIGNTAKSDSEGLYFMPIRNTAVMITGGVVVYHEDQAIEIAKMVDGKVQYILVDAEKKIPHSLVDQLVNVERVVWEVVHKSTLWIYKGNDLSVDAVDGLLTQLTKNDTKGLGGKKVTILGAGNLGAKLALKLVERGADVIITRRNKEVLDVITKALNFIKPIYTQAMVTCMINNEEAAKGAEILIGTTQGIPIITSEMIKNLAGDAIIIDVGKGVLYPDAIEMAEAQQMTIYRLDVSAAFEGLIQKLWSSENLAEKKFGRRKLRQENLVSGGLLGRENEIVVDNVWNPSTVYGIADGRGDFVRHLSKDQILRINKLQDLLYNI